MPEAQPDQNLHLPSLVIKNFRGIDELTIPRLGRVTLLAGKNGVGKTTVLDAVRIWAAGGNDAVINDVLVNRGDFFVKDQQDTGGGANPYGFAGQTGSEGDLEKKTNVIADSASLFTRRQLWPKIDISIGTTTGAETLRLAHRLTNQSPIVSERFAFEKKSGTEVVPPPRPVACNNMGPGGPTDEMIELYWNGIALTSHEDKALEALNLTTDGAVERIALVDSTAKVGQPYRRRFMAKVAGRDHPIPIRTLGDGAMRAFAVALSLAKSSNGFLLIDEAENGIHHSIQAKFWNMVLQTAQRNNVQVLATTHSWDCVVGFAKAANELEEVEGVLYRIQRNRERLRAVEYPEETLRAAVKHRIEVR